MRTDLVAGTALLSAALSASLLACPQGDARLEPSQVAQFSWRQLGPANMGGRIVDIEVAPTDPSTWWVAVASAGLLKTTNNGITFEHQFDHEEVASVGAVATAPSDRNVVWVGTGENNPRNSVSYGAGVFKSVDGGKTWANMGLRESFQIGDIVIDPRDPNVVWVGALGRLYGPNRERGLYVTRDGGSTWRQALSVDDRTGVIDIAMSPGDPDTMLVATYERERDGFDTNDPSKRWGEGGGVWRSADGGKTFERVTDGLPTVLYGRVGFDWYQKDPNVVFAIIESDAIGKAGEGVGWSGIDAVDAETGAKVTAVTKGSPAEAAGLAKDDIVLSVGGKLVLSSRRMSEELAQSNVGDQVVLEFARGGESHSATLTLAERPAPRRQRGRGGNAESESGEEPSPAAAGRSDDSADRPFGEFLGGQVANAQRLQGARGFQHGGVYRSDDAGRSWRRINSINPRPMYFSQVRVDPSDDRWLFVLGVSMSRSADGGDTFTADAGRGVHADQHALWIDPRDGRHMIVGCDGGIYQTYDRGDNWDHLNHAALGQFYHVAVSPQRDYWVYGGLQDNGTWGAPQRADRGSGVINEDWLRVGSGDGFVVAVDAEDPDLVYYESQNGGTGRTNLRTLDNARIRPRPEKGVEYRFNWKTPFVLSHHNSRICYSAGNHVFRSLNRGDDLAPISPDITRTDRGSATAIAESPRDADALYVGTDDGALWGTRDGGHTWQDLWILDDVQIGEATPVEASATSGGSGDGAVGNGAAVAAEVSAAGPAPLGHLVPDPRCVSSIETSRYADGRVYLTLDGHRSDDDAPYVFVTEDHGQTWTSLRANLPRGSTRAVREDIENENVLYLGTEFGFYVSLDRGAHWTRFQGELPTVAIHDFAQHPLSGELVLATHGRSLWALDVTPLRQMTAEALAADAFLFEPNDVVTWRTRHRRAASGAREFFGENPDSDAEIFYRLKQPARSIKLTIRGADGSEVRTLDADAAAGIHKVVWDLRPTPATPSADGGGGRGGRRGGGFRGRSAAPGTYRAVLEVDGKTFEQSFEVIPDPSIPERR